MNPAQACAHTIQWSYDNLIKKNHSDDIVYLSYAGRAVPLTNGIDPLKLNYVQFYLDYYLY